MSEAVRTALAAAASTVDGVNCTPYYRQTTKAGDAMVRLDHTDYPNPFGGITTWQVVVILPQDQAQAEKWIDTHDAALREALDEEFVIRRVTPQQLVLLDASSVPALFIEGTRESE